MAGFSIAITVADETDWIDRGLAVRSIYLFCHEDERSDPNTPR